MADFPTSVYDPRKKENRSAVVYAPLETKRIFAEDITKLDAEVVAIETFLETELKTITVSLSSADILALHTTPKVCIPAPGAGKIAIIESAVFSLDAGATPYSAGINMAFYYAGSSILLSGQLSSSAVKSSTDWVASLLLSASTTSNLFEGVNTNVVFKTMSGSAFADGNGTAKLFIKYRIITL